MANLSTDFEVSQKQIEVDLLNQQKQNQRWLLITIAGILFSTFVLLFMFYRNIKIKQKANALLQEQKKKVETTLINLKNTQSQLIQSEKMASLGELTAGIAHEIQNPLNFVNNFSELNRELIAELKEEVGKGDLEEVKAIADDIAGNEEKINHHGQRASSIVKGMLEHSRTSSGQKEPTDLNALCDEYLRLAYHGLRAKDKSFNADFKTELDPNLPKINVIPQDIGRVLLNLINNAFYAVSSKASDYAKASSDKSSIEGNDYKPTVTVKTKKHYKLIEIRVKDNADGIPSNIINKIFQPFFTTKPTGQGTGLGLSLSYDIITKGHNGTLEVDTTEGIGSEFIIQLPVV
jgi:signal transduction histidine kinase